jgi:hypothetical protein
VQELLVALETEDLGGVTANARRFGTNLRVVPERQAVQLLGCNGGILAHIPVSATVLQRLAE